MCIIKIKNKKKKKIKKIKKKKYKGIINTRKISLNTKTTIITTINNIYIY